MSLTTAEEALVRELIAVNPELLTLAGSEATIISKLGATKKNLGQLTAAGTLSDTDLIFTRQGTLDRSATLSVLRAYALNGIPAASETVSGVVELATVAEAVAGTDNSRAVTPAGVAAVAKPQGVSGARKNLRISYTGTSAVVTVTADELCLGNGSGGYVTLRNLNLTASSGAASGSANSLDTGAWAFSTFYYEYVIYNGTTSALLWSLSATSPTLPSGYTYFARVGVNKTQSITNYWFLGGVQCGDEFQYKVTSGSNVTSLPLVSSGSQGSVSTPTWIAVSISAVTPPSAVAVDLIPSLSSSGGVIILAPNSAYGAYGSSTNPPVSQTVTAGTSTGASTVIRIRLESNSIYWASNTASSLLQCFGWKDNI